MNSEFPQIEQRAREYFTDANPAHDWFHVQRVETNAKRIANAESADIETVTLAVLLHDIGRVKEDRGEIDDHAAWGATEAARILREENDSEERITAVAHCISAHRYSTGPEPETLEAKVLSDADNLDALGATGIARTFTYGVEHDTPIADPALPPESDSSVAGKTSLNHLHKKILQLKDRMYTETGKELAKQRHSFVEEFVEQLSDEIAGE